MANNGAKNKGEKITSSRSKYFIPSHQTMLIGLCTVHVHDIMSVVCAEVCSAGGSTSGGCCDVSTGQQRPGWAQPHLLCSLGLISPVSSIKPL